MLLRTLIWCSVCAAGNQVIMAKLGLMPKLVAVLRTHAVSPTVAEHALSAIGYLMLSGALRELPACVASLDCHCHNPTCRIFEPDLSLVLCAQGRSKRCSARRAGSLCC